MIELLIYLLAIALAEGVTVFIGPLWGILCQIFILAVIAIRSGFIKQQPYDSGTNSGQVVQHVKVQNVMLETPTPVRQEFIFLLSIVRHTFHRNELTSAFNSLAEANRMLAEANKALTHPIEAPHAHSFSGVKKALLKLKLTSSYQRLVLPLILVPLLKIISLTMADLNIPQEWSNLATYVPILVAAVLAIVTLKLRPIDIGINLKWLDLQAGFGLTGILLGIVSYHFLAPKPIISGLTLNQFLVPALILLLCTGFIEELIFRGIIQHGLVEELGNWGIIYVSILYAVLYMDYIPHTWMVFAFLISIYFGLIVKQTKSILGVSMAHGICNIALYLVLPFH